MNQSNIKGSYAPGALGNAHRRRDLFASKSNGEYHKRANGLSINYKPWPKKGVPAAATELERVGYAARRNGHDGRRGGPMGSAPRAFGGYIVIAIDDATAVLLGE